MNRCTVRYSRSADRLACAGTEKYWTFKTLAFVINFLYSFLAHTNFCNFFIGVDIYSLFSVQRIQAQLRKNIRRGEVYA